MTTDKATLESLGDQELKERFVKCYFKNRELYENVTTELKIQATHDCAAGQAAVDADMAVVDLDDIREQIYLRKMADHEELRDEAAIRMSGFKNALDDIRLEFTALLCEIKLRRGVFGKTDSGQKAN